MLTIAGIPVEVRRKRIKHLHLYVKPPDGHVLLTAPMRMSDAEIERFVQTKAGWLQKHVAKIAGRPRPVKADYADGGTLLVWGRPYAIEIRHGGKNAVALTGDTAVLTARKDSTAAQRETFLREWYREQLKTETALRLPRWEAATGLHAAGWQTKDMRTRWGTCNIKTRKIWLNVQLAKKPPECLDYIILHELAHLVERGHNRRFYALLDTFMPEWREVKAKLR
jgi:predicted metal-dependent hydrolase